MPDRYWFHCDACGYRDIRYRNVRRCPECGGGLVREEPVRPDVGYLDELDRLRGLLLDCWFQFAYENGGGYRDGGLSTLERLRAELEEAGLIDEKGMAVER